jgi:hypothetical protein
MATPETFRKLTDPVIPTQNGAVALDDLLHTVDVSDTSKGAAGTSKRTAIQKIVDVVESSLNLDSGTWTPTFSEGDSAASNPVLVKAQYSKVGNIVNCTITGTVDLDFSAAVCGNFIFDYPFAPSTNNSIGVASISAFDNIVTGYVANYRIHFCSALTTDIGTVDFYAIFQYEID